MTIFSCEKKYLKMKWEKYLTISHPFIGTRIAKIKRTDNI